LNIAWTSLEPQYASVESLGGGNARIDPAYPGRARVVAQAGPLADTVVVRVIHDIIYVEVMPFRLRAMVGDSIVFSAVGRSADGALRWAPVSWSVEGSAMTLTVVDSARAIGRMVAPGVVTVEATVGWEPVQSGSVQIEGVTSSSLASVSAGEGHNCALTSAGKAYCWGSNFNEFTGTDTYDGCPFAECNTTPMPLRAGLTFAALATGHMATCGITTAGPTWCWGHNYSGQLGTGTSSQLTIREPEQVVGGHQFTQLALGGSHSCALDGQGTAYCWGRNAWGELGTGTGRDHHAPAPVAGGRTWKQLAAGDVRTCGITTADEAFCWGAYLSDVPRRVPQAPVFTTITAGWEHQCGLAVDGQAYCWGLSDDGGLGRGSTELDGDSVPEPVVGGRRFVAIDAGYSFTCALDAAGAAWCWGSDEDGKLGNGGADAASGVPTRVAGGHVFRSIQAGREHACATTGDGSVFCWGRGYWGLLGNGSREDSPVPTRVSAVP
ncbi:MAG TPA: hypothetical protein VHG08_26780, partial [Longimicrobium sp.]|nr:hypothetical protein [Longimicrobium sp.]